MWPDSSLRKTGETVLLGGEVLQMSLTTIHVGSCASVEPCCGIHIYLGRMAVVDHPLFYMATGDISFHTEDRYHRLINAN